MAGPPVFSTPYGRAAAQLLRERLSAAKADDPLHPVSVLVPTNYVSVSTRRLLAGGVLGPVTARGDGIAGLTLLTVYRLAELLGAPALAAEGRRPVSTPLIGAAVRQVLRDAPGIFAPVIDHPSTEEALVRAHRELSELTPSSLTTLERQGRRAADVVRIHRAVRARLEAGWYEEADLMAAAHRAVLAGSPVLDDLGTVLIYLPEELSMPAASLLRALSDATAVEVIAGMTGVAAADAAVVTSLRRLGVEPPATQVGAPPRVDEIVSVSDAEEEVRSAIDRVIAAARDGMALERMAILYPSAEPYARIVGEQLASAGITYNGAAVRPPADRLVGRWLLDLLDLRNRDFDRPSVMGLLTSAPVVDRTGRWIPAGAWERITRDAGIVGGRGEWSSRLERYAGEQQRRADEPAEDAPVWLAERSRDNAERARRLSGTVGSLISALDQAARLRRWSDLSAWCNRMIARWIERRRDRWPQVEVDAAERVEAALDRLAGLDAAEPDTDLATFRRALGLELDDDLGRVGELGRGVLTGPPSSALGVDLDLAVVLGLAEGVAPTRPREDSLLPDAERRAVAAELRPRDERVGIEHRHLLAALAGASRRRVLIQPRGDLRRSVERAPSRWLLDAVEQLDGSGAPRALPHRAPWLDLVPSFAGRVRRTAFPATPQEYGLRALSEVPTGRGVGAGVALLSHPVVSADPRLRRAIDLIRQRTTGDFGRFTGRLGPHAASLVADVTRHRVTSATVLESWLSCPHAYLLQHVLRVKPVENPEELLRITPLDQGSLVHDVLDRWLSDLLEQPLPAARAAWPQAARDLMGTIAADATRDAQERGITGHPLLWRRDRHRLLTDFDAFVGQDDQRRGKDELTPTATELGFGLAPDAPDAAVLRIDLGDGRELRLSGRIDRVDIAADGAVFVADYKTGGTWRYRELGEESPLASGDKLQLPIYGLAIRDTHPDAPGVHTEYWFVSHKGEWKRIGYRLTDAVVEQLKRVLRVVVDGIEGGLFPMRPPAGASYGGYIECVFCDPDGLGASDHFREWERIRTDPALRDYLAAVDPEALAAADEQRAAAGVASGARAPGAADQDTLW